MIRFEQQINFLKEVDKLKNIIRRNYICDGNRFENTAEHSWHLALMVMTLAEHANNEIDILKTILMLFEALKLGFKSTKCKCIHQKLETIVCLNSKLLKLRVQTYDFPNPPLST